MPTNEKRRGVAERLREYPATLVATLNNANNGCMAYVSQLADILGCTNPADIFDRLADLIEPVPERTCHVEYREQTESDPVGVMVCSECWDCLECCSNAAYRPWCGAKVVEK